MATILGQNFKAEVEDGKLFITVNLDGETTPSGSGKSNVIASSRGNKALPGTEPTIYLGLNVYQKVA